LVGYDAGKKVKGRKRSIVTDTLGLLLAVCVHRGDVQDRDGARPTLAMLKKAGRRLKKIFVDGACAGQLEQWAREFGGWVLEVVRRPEIRKFVVLPKRWIVERTFGWIGRARRLSKDYERLARHAESFIYLRMIELMLRRLT
jgi:putative transposase